MMLRGHVIVKKRGYWNVYPPRHPTWGNRWTRFEDAAEEAIGLDPFQFLTLEDMPSVSFR